MAKDEIQEGIEDVEIEDFDEVRGQIQVEKDLAARNVMIGASFLLLVFVFAAAWFLQRQIRSEEEILKERLQKPGVVAEMLAELASVARNPHLSKDDPQQKKELMQALKGAVDISKILLRKLGQTQAPYLPERQLAMIEALEILLRLELEGFIQSDADQQFCQQMLSSLGLEEIEYYENGILEKLALLEQSQIIYEINLEKNRSGYKDERLLKDLQAKLAKVQKRESFTLLAPAYLLGRWYRFYNDMENAERCFQLGRKYIEGYSSKGVFFSGKKIDEIGPLWDEYAGCLEALAEKSFEQKQYRRARSYLMRIFNTPRGAHLGYVSRTMSEQISSVKQQIIRLEKDVSLIKKVLSTVSDLPSYPLFHARDSIFRWEDLVAEFVVGYSPNNDLLSDYLWDQFDQRIRHELEQRKLKGKAAGLSWLTQAMKDRIVEIFNALVQDPSLYQNIQFDASVLSENASELLDKSKKQSLLPQEAFTLNREIIEKSFPKGIQNQYILSDGSYLHNSLSAAQVHELIDLYEEDILHPRSSLKRKRDLQQRVDDIRRSKKRPTLFDLQSILNEKKARQEQIITENETLFDEQRTILLQVQEEIEELEQRGQVDVSTILSLQSQAQLARSRQRQAKIVIKQAETDIDLVQERISNLNRDFRQRLERFEQHLANARDRQEKLRNRNLTERGPLIRQIERQIDLRSKYLTLLKGLQEKGQEKYLAKLDQNKIELEDKIENIQEMIAKSSGNERDALNVRLQQFETERHELVREFDSLFDPLREVIESIKVEEKEVLKAEKLLRQTHEEMAVLMGNTQHSLDAKIQRRTQVLLADAQSVVEGPNFSEELRGLNEEIAADHARLQTLLQTEKYALTTLEAFYPVANEAKISLEEGSLLKLQNYLNRQETLMGRYQLSWEQKNLQEEIYRLEQGILENMHLISKELQNGQKLSKAYINDLSRYMENILQAKSSLIRLKGQLRLVLENVHSQSYEGAGHQLDQLEIFQMEKAMGLNISEYRRTFEQRKQIVIELEEALKEKQELESQKIKYLHLRDQVRVDLLLPQIMESEQIINNLSQQQIVINQHLQALAEQYEEKIAKASAYRKQLDRQMHILAEEIGAIQQEMIQNEEKLEDLRKEIFWTSSKFSHSLTSLSIGDLEGITDLIRHEESKLENLQQMHSLKLKEDLYKAKSLWLIGKSLNEQSLLEDFSALRISNYLDADLMAEEGRIAQLIVKEFNPDFAKSEALFDTEEGVDDANAALWKDFLEKGALRVFEQELPNYVVLEADSSSFVAESSDKKAQNNQFIVRSRFLSGEIYMRRALRFIRASTSPSHKNIKALEEFDAARRSFLSFLDFAHALERQSESLAQSLSEVEFASKEFPQRKRKAIDLMDEARVYLGIIANLQGEPLEAIAHYREILRDLYGTIDQSITFKDPFLFEQYQYDPGLQALYASLLAREPLSHEVLYRMGESYKNLALESLQPAHPFEDIKHKKEAFQKYSVQAIRYYSQLILTQSYSPYRRAALLQRALLRKKIGDYNNARHDLIAILGSPGRKGGSLNQSDMTAKGDLPGDLDPGYTYVAFELGKLYFENNDYALAADIFQRAKKGSADHSYVLQAKIAYAKTLMKTGQWLMADYFLQELLDERMAASEETAHFYHADILLDLASARKNLFNLEGAKQLFRKVFVQYAPSDLLDDEGEIALNQTKGLALLETDYRDSIRPLAQSCLSCADICLLQRDYPAAKVYFKKAKGLFRMLVWKQDRVLRDMSQQEFKNYRAKHLLEIEWGLLKADILDLAFSSYARYRRVAGRGIQLGELVKPEKVLMEVERAIDDAKSLKDSYKALLKRVDEFYQKESERLPERIAREKIQSMRQWDRQLGGQNSHRYDALVRLRDFVLANKGENPRSLIGLVLKNFSRGSLEENFLEAFSMDFAKSLHLSVDDRKNMIPLNSNLDNLLEIKDAGQRLEGMVFSLQRWLEDQMRQTGLDDLFISVSPQALILEDVDVFRCSLLSYFNGQEQYKRVLEIAKHYLKELGSYPQRLQSLEKAWQIVEIAAGLANEWEDWAESATFHAHLLKEENLQFFIFEDRSDLYRAKLAYSKALIEISKNELQFLAYIEDDAEKLKKQKELQQKISISKNLLEELVNIKGSDAALLSTRIRAKQMLNDVKAL